MRRQQLPFVIKVCGITSGGDAYDAVEAGATALGFNFYQGSPRYLNAPQAREIIQQSPGSYLRVGVFVNASESELAETAATAGLDVLQLHGTMPSHLPGGYRLWRAVAAGTRAVPDPAVEAYLIDTPSAAHGGSGVAFDWTLAAGFPAPVIVAGGLHAANVAEAIAAAQPAGVDACSRLETTPGRKDAALVRAFVQAARHAYKELKETVTIA